MSLSLIEKAERFIPGAVNSPVRAFKAVEMTPLFIKKAEGKLLYTEDGQVLTDFCLSWGPMILGHNHGAVKSEISKALRNGTSYGLCHRYEAELAQAVCRNMPSIELVRFVNSGTEAVMTALRLARAFTGRNGIIKFDGCYHGHTDAMLVNAGSGVAEDPAASSSGIGLEAVSDTYSLPYNDKEAFQGFVRTHGRKIAAVIVEPAAGNMGLVPPGDGFLETLRKGADENGFLLIFDEVITGFRVGLGGAQGRYGIKPDITTLGKIIGGGLPVGAVGGRKDIMTQLAPIGKVYQAGTLSGNPLAMRAGLAVLRQLEKHRQLYARMEGMVEEFAREFEKIAPYSINRLGSMFTVFYTRKAVRNFQDAQSQDREAFKRHYHKLLDQGLFFPPALFETAFISSAHNWNDMERILKVFREESRL